MRKIASFILLLSLAWQSHAALVLLDRVAVIVDEDVVMQSEIDERMLTIKAQITAQPGAKAPPDEVLQEQIIERLIIESLQLQTADRAGIRISDDELNQALASIAYQNQMDMDEFRVALANDGVSWAQMREQVRREFAISRVQQGIMRAGIQPGGTAAHHFHVEVTAFQVDLVNICDLQLSPV